MESPYSGFIKDFAGLLTGVERPYWGDKSEGCKTRIVELFTVLHEDGKCFGIYRKKEHAEIAIEMNLSMDKIPKPKEILLIEVPIRTFGEVYEEVLEELDAE